MSALSATQQGLLRYWAMNMAMVDYSWFPFEYDYAEKKRLAAIVNDVPLNAYAGVVLFSAIFYLVSFALGGTLFLGPLLAIYPTGTPVPDALFLAAMAGTIVFALSIGMPLAIGYGGHVVDWLLGMPALKAAEGDAELYLKIRFQFGCIAILGVTALGLWIWLSLGFGIDTTTYDSTVRWIYSGVLGVQAVLAFRFLRGRR